MWIERDVIEWVLPMRPIEEILMDFAVRTSKRAVENIIRNHPAIDEFYGVWSKMTHL